MCIHSVGSSSFKPQMHLPQLETASAPSLPSTPSVSPQSAVAREWARDSFTPAPATAVSRPRIDLG
jgi:hypothetical protein